MLSRSRHQSHIKYKNKIDDLLKNYNSLVSNSEIEMMAHNAKYIAVLVSGYLEQAIKEVLLNYANQGSRQHIIRYLEKSWPKSRNMNTSNIDVILKQFSKSWSISFASWISDQENRKGDINNLVSWRNDIAHGNESNTTGVTISSVSQKFTTIKSLVTFIESLADSK